MHHNNRFSESKVPVTELPSSYAYPGRLDSRAQSLAVVVDPLESVPEQRNDNRINVGYQIYRDRYCGQ